jgi:hypothetical protein
MEAASFFIVFVETDLDCSQRDKNNKKDTADSRIQLLKKKLFGYKSFVSFHDGSTFITSS